MAVKKKQDIGYLGEDFQYRLIHHFMEDRDCFKDLSAIIDQNMFTNPTLKMFVGIMKEHYEKFDVVPSYDIMRIAMKEKSHNETDAEINDATVTKILETKEDSVDYIHELALKFFRQQNIIKTANKILSIAGNGDTSKYEECVDLLNNALHQGVHDDFGSSVFDDLEETLSDDYRVTVPTGISRIDETLEGGLGKGELGVIICPTGFGKTSLTTAMASHAATFRCPQNNYAGFKVLQIVFEDRVKQIQRKHIARLVTKTSGKTVEAKDLSKEEYIGLVREELDRYEYKDMLTNNLKIVRLPNGEITASYIKQMVKKYTNNGFKPDLMIVDYFECLDTSVKGYSSETSSEWSQEGKTMRRFESMASELDLAIWIPSQGSKDSVNAELVTVDKIGGSKKKSEIAHIIISIARSTEDIANNKARIAILKNRAGCSGKVFNNVSFNNGTCVIECNDDSDGLDMLTYGKELEKEKNDLTRSIMKDILSKSKKKN